MADLLGRLAARTLGLGEDAQPLLAPLFASERPPDAPEIIAPLPESEPGGAPARGLKTASDAKSVSNQAPPLAPSPIAARRSSSQQPVTAATPGQVQTAVDSEQGTPFPSPTSPRATSIDRRSALLVPRPADGDAVIAAQADRPMDRFLDEMPPANAPLLSHRAAVASTPSQTAAIDIPPPLVAIRTPPPLVATGGPLQPEPASHRRQSISEVKEPAVQVTIGRIDVRAVLPDQPPAHSEPPTGPRLTIEEYSRQRREGLR